MNQFILTIPAAAPDVLPKPAFVAEQFDRAAQQHEAGKMGMWIFITTEMLLFGALFTLYAVYRSNHPEIFAYSSLYMNKTAGAINTGVLLTSSFTVAWAVRAIQLNQVARCKALLCVTLVLGALFLAIKGYEYKEHAEKRLLVGEYYQPTEAPPNTASNSKSAVNVPAQVSSEIPQFAQAGLGTQAGIGARPDYGASLDAGAQGGAGVQAGGGGESALNVTPEQAIAAAKDSATQPTPQPQLTADGWMQSRSLIPQAAAGPHGLAARFAPMTDWSGPAPMNARTFFSLYYALTGLHALHVLVGMACIAWALSRTRRHYNAHYYYPVDIVALYWHLVDMIWIFLFPILYLVH